MKSAKTVLSLAAAGCLVSFIAFAGPEAGHPNIIAAREAATRAIEKA